MDNIIEVKDVCKTYKGTKKGGPKEALSHINLSIPRGSFYGLLGPNGAGKSTIINIIAGLTMKTSGSITINGVDIDKDPRGTRFQIGVVPQEVVLDPFFSVWETLDYFAGYYGVPKEKRRTEEILKALHLTDKRDASSRRLSGGMKRRVLIAKALVHSPPILVLDEPTAGVDVDLRLQLWDYVRELNKRGTTVLLTTHYLEEAEELCDRIAVINHGRIIADDSTHNLMNILDQKQLVLHLKDPVKKLPKSLAKWDVQQQDEKTLSLRYRKSEAPITAILDKAKKGGLAICDISTDEPDLEDIFRHLIHQK